MEGDRISLVYNWQAEICSSYTHYSPLNAMKMYIGREANRRKSYTRRNTTHIYLGGRGL